MVGVVLLPVGIAGLNGMLERIVVEGELPVHREGHHNSGGIEYVERRFLICGL